MFALLIMGLMASMASAEPDPQFFYYPSYSYSAPSYYYPTYPTYQYTSPSYYYPSVYPSYVYQPTVKKVVSTPAKVETPKVTPEVTLNKQSKPLLRPIVPAFDYLRDGSNTVTFLRPDEVKPTSEEDETNILTYTVPYTQAYLNRVPAF